jgi:hypothetical protein
MIVQLGPPSFFITFTTCVNNWPILVKQLKNLHIEHVQNFNLENKDLPNIKDFVKNDPITFVRYYEHRMNSFQFFSKNNSILFRKINDFLK